MSRLLYIAKKKIIAGLGLVLTWDNIINVPVADASNVAQWNTFFSLPLNGSPFTSVVVAGNEVNLIGGSGIALKDNLFRYNYNIVEIVDLISCITSIGAFSLSSTTSLVNAKLYGVIISGNFAFNGSGLINLIAPILKTAGLACFQNMGRLLLMNLPSLETGDDYCFDTNTSGSYNLPNLTSIGGAGFSNNLNMTNLFLPALVAMGSTILDDNIFTNTIGNVIDLTIPSALMTCNNSQPDGDIQYLQANNTVTIITV